MFVTGNVLFCNGLGKYTEKYKTNLLIPQLLVQLTVRQNLFFLQESRL